MIAKFFNALPLSENLKIVTKNFSFLAAWQLLLNFLPFLTIPYLMRVIGVENYGLLVFVQSFVMYFGILLDYGFNYSSLREISIYKNDVNKVSAIVNAVMALKLFFLFLTFLIIAITCFFVPKFQGHWLLCLFFFFLLAGTSLNPAFLFQGMEKMKYIFFLSLPSVLSTLLVFVFVRGPKDYIYVPLLGMCFSLLSGVWGLILAYRKFRLKIAGPKISQVMYELKEGGSIFFANFFCTGHANFRIFFLGFVAGNVITGYYAVGDRLMSLLILFPFSLLFQVLFPRLCEIYESNRAYALFVAKKIQWFLIGIYLIMVTVSFIFSREIVQFMCGSFSYESMISFRLLLTAVFANVMICEKNLLLLISNRRNTIAKISITGGILGTLCGLPLIYYFSYIGAALSIILVNTANVVMTFFVVRKFKDLKIDPSYA